MSSANLEKSVRMKTAFVENANAVATKDFGLDLHEIGTPKYEAKLAQGMMKNAGSLVGARARIRLYTGMALSVLNTFNSRSTIHSREKSTGPHV